MMNAYSEDDLPDRLSRAQAAELHPLRMHAVTATGAVEEAIAFNEVSLLRQLRLASKVRISVDGRVRLEELSCDGVLSPPPPAPPPTTCPPTAPSCRCPPICCR